MAESKLLPETKCISIQMADTDTGELLLDRDLKKVFFGSSGSDDGEKYLFKLVDSLCKGLRSGRNLSLRVSVFPFITPVEADLFEPNILDYPLLCVPIQN